VQLALVVHTTATYHRHLAISLVKVQVHWSRHLAATSVSTHLPHKAVAVQCCPLAPTRIILDGRPTPTPTLLSIFASLPQVTDVHPSRPTSRRWSFFATRSSSHTKRAKSRTSSADEPSFPVQAQVTYRPFSPSRRMTAPQISTTPPLLHPIPISRIEPCSCCSLGEHNEVEWNPYVVLGMEVPVGMTMTPWVPLVTASRTPPAARFASTSRVGTTPSMSSHAAHHRVPFTLRTLSSPVHSPPNVSAYPSVQAPRPPSVTHRHTLQKHANPRRLSHGNTLSHTQPSLSSPTNSTGTGTSTIGSSGSSTGSRILGLAGFKALAKVRHGLSVDRASVY